MALDINILNSNTGLSGLTDEQKATIVELSKNDEAQVIGQKIGEIYGGLDKDIEAASGISKNGAEKTYDYAKRVIGEIKAKAGDSTELQRQITELTNEKTRLQGIIDKGGTDDETKRQLTQTKADLEQARSQYNELKTNFDNEKAEHEKALFNVRLDNDLATASVGMKFKPEISDSVKTVLLQQAINKVKGMKPEYADNGAGGKVLIFRKEDGGTRLNPDTNLNPYTAKELIAKELKDMGVLDTGIQQQGAGSSGNGTGGSGSGTFDFSGAKTQVEAQEILSKTLMQQGMAKGSKTYQEAFDKAWKENYPMLKSLPQK